MLIVVLGMHRSGTSALTGLLETCGFSPGNVPSQSRGNPKGNREYQPIRKLNNAMLNYAGGGWRDPVRVPRAPSHLKSQMEEAYATLREKHTKIVVKDPRLLWTLDAWRPVWGDMQLVGSFRHPEAVARSLEKRNRFDTEAALALWQAYNEQLIGLHRNEPFPLVSFDLQGQAYLDQFKTLVEQLSLQPEARIESNFYDQQLIHHTYLDLPVQAEHAETYAYLRRHSVGKWLD